MLPKREKTSSKARSPSPPLSPTKTTTFTLFSPFGKQQIQKTSTPVIEKGKEKDNILFSSLFSKKKTSWDKIAQYQRTKLTHMLLEDALMMGPQYLPIPTEDFMILLRDYKRQCIEKEMYDECDLIDKVQKKVEDEILVLQQKKLRDIQTKEKMTIMEAEDAEKQRITDEVHTQKIDFEQKFQESYKKLVNRHTAQMVELSKQYEKEVNVLKTRISSGNSINPIIQSQKKVEKTLAELNEFELAKQQRKEIEKMEHDTIAQALKDLEFRFEARSKVLLEAQKKDLQVLISKHKEKFEWKFGAKLKREEENVTKRFNNIKQKFVETQKKIFSLSSQDVYRKTKKLFIKNSQNQSEERRHPEHMKKELTNVLHDKNQRELDILDHVIDNHVKELKKKGIPKMPSPDSTLNNRGEYTTMQEILLYRNKNKNKPKQLWNGDANFSSPSIGVRSYGDMEFQNMINLEPPDKFVHAKLKSDYIDEHNNDENNDSGNSKGKSKKGKKLRPPEPDYYSSSSSSQASLTGSSSNLLSTRTGHQIQKEMLLSDLLENKNREFDPFDVQDVPDLTGKDDNYNEEDDMASLFENPNKFPNSELNSQTQNNFTSRKASTFSHGSTTLASAAPVLSNDYHNAGISAEKLAAMKLGEMTLKQLGQLSQDKPSSRPYSSQTKANTIFSDGGTNADLEAIEREIGRDVEEILNDEAEEQLFGNKNTKTRTPSAKTKSARSGRNSQNRNLRKEMMNNDEDVDEEEALMDNYGEEDEIEEPNTNYEEEYEEQFIPQDAEAQQQEQEEIFIEEDMENDQNQGNLDFGHLQKPRMYSAASKKSLQSVSSAPGRKTPLRSATSRNSSLYKQIRNSPYYQSNGIPQKSQIVEPKSQKLKFSKNSNDVKAREVENLLLKNTQLDDDEESAINHQIEQEENAEELRSVAGRPNMQPLSSPNHMMMQKFQNLQKSRDLDVNIENYTNDFDSPRRNRLKDQTPVENFINNTRIDINRMNGNNYNDNSTTKIPSLTARTNSTVFTTTQSQYEEAVESFANFPRLFDISVQNPKPNNNKMESTPNKNAQKPTKTPPRSKSALSNSKVSTSSATTATNNSAFSNSTQSNSSKHHKKGKNSQQQQQQQQQFDEEYDPMVTKDSYLVRVERSRRKNLDKVKKSTKEKKSKSGSKNHK